MSDAIIIVRDVWHHYGVRPVLRGIDLEVQRGELVVVMGVNGVGKTTLLGVMAGALSPYRGWVEIDGLRRRSTEETELAARARVAYLPAEDWTPWLSGREFLVAAGMLYKIPEDRLFDHVERLLKLFNLEAVADKQVAECSTGQRKKFALCSALVTETPVMLLDEPFSGGLDPLGIQALKRVLKKLAAERGTTIVMTSPVPELVEELADRIVLLDDGRVVAHDTIDGLRASTGCDGPLEEVLERIMRPGGGDQAGDYFAGGRG